MNKTLKIGLVDQDIIALINWKKADKEKRKGMVCNQLSMVDDFSFHDFWWKLGGVNPELYWELHYEWYDEYYFHTGYFKAKMWRCLKKFNFLAIISTFIKWITWNEIVKINYQLHVKLPYQIRNK